VANVQVKLATDGEPALLEVNPRFPGTMSLTVASGINMPALAVSEALGDPLPPGPLPFDEVAMVRFLEERFFDFEEIAALQRQAEPVHA
jgi:carbamoyl-phosphate synthase large subunit